MSTRCFIGKELIDSRGRFSYYGIYCHFDGYLDDVGKTLVENYTNESIINELISLGDISSLGNGIFSTVAYHRDHGEDLNIREYSSLEDILKDGWMEYAYIWDGEEWSVFSKHSIPLRFVLEDKKSKDNKEISNKARFIEDQDGKLFNIEEISELRIECNEYTNKGKYMIVATIRGIGDFTIANFFTQEDRDMEYSNLISLINDSYVVYKINKVDIQ